MIDLQQNQRYIDKLFKLIVKPATTAGGATHG